MGKYMDGFLGGGEGGNRDVKDGRSESKDRAANERMMKTQTGKKSGSDERGGLNWDGCETSGS